MKLYLGRIFVFMASIIFTAKAQNTSLVKVTYEENNGMRKNKSVILYANQKSAVFIEDFGNKKSNKNVATSGDDPFHISFGNQHIDDNFLFSQYDLDTLLQVTYVEKTKYKIIDAIPSEKWQLVPNETKQIGSYKCEKATILFRGTKLTAYYTKEIPIPFGPYKFKGLPGLILAIYQDNIISDKINGDIENSWVASDIQTIKDGSFNLQKFKDSAFDDAESITYKDFHNLTEKLQNDQIKKIQATAPPGTTFSEIYAPRLTVEQKYEWEN